MPKPFLTITVTILAVFLIWSVMANFKLLQKRKEAQKQVLILSEKVANLEESGEVVEQTILKGKTIDYLERTAREELNFQKPGETVVAFPAIQEELSSSSTALPEKSLWQKLKSFFILRD